MSLLDAKPVPGHEDNYLVTRDGRVWSVRSRKFLKPGRSGQGRYHSICVSRDGKLTTKYVHRLVAEAFIPNPENKLTVNHKSGDKADNSVSNLEWATQQEQIAHAISTGLSNSIGELNGAAKLTEAQVEEIRHLYVTDMDATQESLGKKFSVHRVLIKQIVTGKSWAHTWDEGKYSRPPRWKNKGLHRRDSKFTLELAAEIRTRYAAGGCTTRSLGAEYGIPSSLVSMIQRGLAWTD